MGSFVGCRCLQENKPEGASSRLGTDPCTLIHEVLFVFKVFSFKGQPFFLHVLCCVYCVAKRSSWGNSMENDPGSWPTWPSARFLRTSLLEHQLQQVISDSRC